jgi:hypothetical protein
MSTAFDPWSAEGAMSSPRSRSTAKHATEDRRSAIAGAAERVREEASSAARSLASEARDKIRSKLDEQVGTGADLMGDVAGSVRTAANELERNSPRLASFARSAADTIDAYADSMRDRSVDELLRAGTKFARKQPALVFGAAALAGFALYRVFTAEMESERNRRRRSRSAEYEAGIDDETSFQTASKPLRRKSGGQAGGESYGG